MIIGLDADTVLTAFYPDIAAKLGAIPGVTEIFVCRYLKNLTGLECQAAGAAGVRVVPIWETTAERALQGSSAGALDGAATARAMQAFGFPAGTGAVMTVDTDVSEEQMPIVTAYFQQANASLSGAGYIESAYAEGAVLDAEGTKFRWLPQASGWTGSRGYQNWTMRQGPTMTHGGSWAGIDWPDLGFEYDPDIVADGVTDYGGYLFGPVVSQPTPPQDAPLPILNRGSLGNPVKMLQALLNKKGYRLTVDGDFGPTTERVVKSFQQMSGLQPDGVVGPLTWAKLNA